MNLDIVLQGLDMLLRLPTRSPGSQLDFFVTGLGSDLTLYLPESRWDDLYDGHAMDVPLPLSSWRRVLSRMQRSHDFYRSPEKRKSFLDRLDPDYRASFDDSPLTFTLDGVVYASPHEIPAPAELTVDLGTFELTTSTVLATDPCYEKGTWCTGEFDAQTGTWQARTLLRDDKYSGHRNAVLFAAHMSVPLDSLVLAEMIKTDIDVGVDSGQAGFFEKLRYPDDNAQLESDDGTWYSAVCNITLDDAKHNAGIAPTGCGVVTQTFWGDGGYPCFVKKDNNGLVVAAAIVFDGSMSQDEDEEGSDGDGVSQS